MLAIMAFYAENYKKSDKIFYLFYLFYLIMLPLRAELKEELYGNYLQSAFFLLISKANEGKRRYKIR